MADASPISNYVGACEYLIRLKQRGGVSLGLSRIERLLAKIGHPERAIPCVHVAGTNGKGSVSAMLEAILRAAGWRTGLYTSPHLVRLGERIQVDRQQLSESELTRYVQELQPMVEELAAEEGQGGGPSYFEVMTAMALLHFVRSCCDIVVIEVGLGGRLDATNVVNPAVSVITSIGLDHCVVLGNTLAEIATEKAGIIKPGRPVVVGRLPREAEDVIRVVAGQQGARVISVAEEFGEDFAGYPTTNAAGAYQRINAATATLAARALSPSWRISESVIARALQTIDWPARWQRFSVGGRTVILDSSHNAEGAQMLDANLRALRDEFGRAPFVVVGVLGTARARPLLEVICRHAQEIHLVRPAQSRASSYEELEELVPPSYQGQTVRDSVAPLFPTATMCTLGEPGDVIVVTGSIYLAGEVLSRVDPTRGPYEGHLQDF